MTSVLLFWEQVRVDRKFRAGAPMRVGVQRTGVRCGMNWNDKKLKDQAWYLDSSGTNLCFTAFF
jgi:hypothetical protein